MPKIRWSQCGKRLRITIIIGGIEITIDLPPTLAGKPQRNTQLSGFLLKLLKKHLKYFPCGKLFSLSQINVKELLRLNVITLLREYYSHFSFLVYPHGKIPEAHSSSLLTDLFPKP